MRASISAFFPAPSTIVVSSLSIVTFLARPSISQRDVLELDAEILGHDAAARDGGDVLEHGLAAVAKARSLDGRNL